MRGFEIHYQRDESHTINEKEENEGQENGYLYRECGMIYRNVRLRRVALVSTSTFNT